MKYDIEKLLGDVKNTMVQSLNAKLDAIATEKNDSISTPHIGSNAYFLQELNSRVANYNPFILYGIENSQTIVQGPVSATTFELFCLVCATDGGQDSNVMARMFRYGRALKEIFEESWVRSEIKLAVKSISPVPFKDENSNKTGRVVGVLISGDLY